MTRLARIVLNGTRTDDELDPITLDLFLDGSRCVVQKFPTSGWWGKLKNSEELMPFIFFPTGRMDFGTGFEQEDRYAETNIEKKRLDLGEYVTVSDNYGEHCFRVSQVLWADELAEAV